MPTVDPTVKNSALAQAGADDGSVILYTWVLTTAAPTGTAIALPEWADRTVHAFADPSGVGAPDIWGGATLTWQGANRDVDALYDTLANAAGGSGATWTVDGVKAIIELPLFMRPKLTTVGVSAAVTVTALIRRANPLRT